MELTPGGVHRIRRDGTWRHVRGWREGFPELLEKIRADQWEEIDAERLKEILESLSLHAANPVKDTGSEKQEARAGLVKLSSALRTGRRPLGGAPRGSTQHDWITQMGDAFLLRRGLGLLDVLKQAKKAGKAWNGQADAMRTYLRKSGALNAEGETFWINVVRDNPTPRKLKRALGLTAHQRRVRP